jgi:hypothetical protein
MPRQIAVFDTNIYLALGATRTAELARRQRAAGVISRANVWTVAELSSHLADAHDPHYSRCLGALRALWQHCSLYDGSTQYLPFVPDTEELLSTSLFGQRVAGREEEIEATSTFVGRVANCQGTTELHEALSAVGDLRRHVARVEAEFVDSMRHMVQHLDPDAQGWETFRNDPERRQAILARIDAGVGSRYFAEGLVTTAARLVGATLVGEAFEQRVELVLANCGAPIQFFDAIVRKLVSGGIDRSKSERANSIWDLQIAFYGNPGWTMDGVPLVLVTEERAIRDAAVRAGDSSAVMSLQEFSTSLDSVPLP